MRSKETLDTDVNLSATENQEWHENHQLPDAPTLEQRIKWHMEHARRCSCPSHDDDIRSELEKRFSGTHQDFWIYFNAGDHKKLGLWAARITEHLLPYFEENNHDDTRPADAIRTLHEWAKTGEFRMPVIRGASLGAHAAAKQVAKEDKGAAFAAHAAGQAVGTAHVPTHAIGAVLYSIKLVAFANPSNAKAAVAKERDWQTEILPENLRGWVDSRVKRTVRSLPRDLRERLE